MMSHQHNYVTGVDCVMSLCYTDATRQYQIVLGHLKLETYEDGVYQVLFSTSPFETHEMRGY